MPERSIASHEALVVAPMCGEAKKFGTSMSGLPLAGSTANTSNALHPTPPPITARFDIHPLETRPAGSMSVAEQVVFPSPHAQQHLADQRDVGEVRGVNGHHPGGPWHELEFR